MLVSIWTVKQLLLYMPIPFHFPDVWVETAQLIADMLRSFLWHYLLLEVRNLLYEVILNISREIEFFLEHSEHFQIDG